MAKIDIAVAFFTSYLDAEHAEKLAFYSEPDDILRSLREISESFMHALPGTIMSSALGRAPISPEELARQARYAQIAHRVLFLVTEYCHHSLGQLFAGFTSGGAPLLTDSYEHLLYATEINGQLKIVADYLVDFDSVASVGWQHIQGVEIGYPGTLASARPLVAPGDPDHQRHWAAIRDAVL